MKCKHMVLTDVCIHCGDEKQFGIGKNLKSTKYLWIVLVTYRIYEAEYLTLELSFKRKSW